MRSLGTLGTMPGIGLPRFARNDRIGTIATGMSLPQGGTGGRVALPQGIVWSESVKKKEWKRRDSPDMG